MINAIKNKFFIFNESNLFFNEERERERDLVVTRFLSFRSFSRDSHISMVKRLHSCGSYSLFVVSKPFAFDLEEHLECFDLPI